MFKTIFILVPLSEITELLARLKPGFDLPLCADENV